MTTHTLPVAVIGAGPVGLAAAAHLISRGETPLVLEAGATVGASVREWGHVRLFSPWRFVVDPVAAAMLEATGWTAPPADDLPTGNDLIDRYLDPLSRLPQIAPHLRLGARVVSVARQGVNKMKTPGREDAPFVLRVQDGDGSLDEILARAVIDASGTWTSPNPLGAGGQIAIGETSAGEHIAYGIPDVLGTARGRYAGKRVLVVGSGHSAFNALLDLATLAEQAPGTEITWAVRSDVARDLFGAGEGDALPARGALGQRLRGLVDAGAIRFVPNFRTGAVRRREDGVEVVGGAGSIGPVDEIIAATGFRPDLTLTAELRLALDPAVESPVALAPLIDPNVHSCGTVPPHGFQELSHPEQNFYTVGMKSYGRAPTFLLLTGYEQVRSVVAALTGDLEAARDVKLELPETGACGGPAPAVVQETPATAGIRASTVPVVETIAAASCGAPSPMPDLLTVMPAVEPVASGCCGGPAPAGTSACCALDAEAKAAGESGCGCGSTTAEPVSAAAPAGAH